MPTGDRLDILLRLRGARQAAAEAKAVTGAVRGTAGAVRQADSAASRANRGFGMFRRHINETGKASKLGAAGFRTMGRSILSMAAGVSSLAAGKKAISTTTDLAKTTLTLSKSFGMSTKTASQWAANMKVRGAEGKQLTMGFKTFASQVQGAAEGTGKAASQFDKLGISQRTLKKHGNDMNFMLHRVSDGLGKLPPGTKKADVMAKLFGRTWTSISPMLRSGSKAMDEQLNMATKYGATFGGKSIKSMEDWIKAQRESKMAMLGLEVTLGTTLVPALTRAVTFIMKAKLAFDSLPQSIRMVGLAIAAIGGAFLFAGPIGAVIAAIAVAGILIYKNWNKVGPIFQRVKTFVVGAFNTIKPHLSGLVRDFKGAIPALRNLGKVFQWVMLNVWLPIAKRALPGVIQVFKGAINIIRGIVRVISGILTGDFGKAWSGVKLIFRGAFQVIWGILRAGTAPIRAVLGGIGSFIGRVFGRGWALARGLFSRALRGILTILRVTTAPARAAANLLIRVITFPFRKAGDIVAWVRRAFNNVVGTLRNAKNRIGSTARGMWDGIKNAFKSAINVIIRGWNSLDFRIPAIDPPGPGKFPGVTIGVPNIPEMAAGGVIRRAGLSIVGDAGPELLNLPRAASVSPLSAPSIPDYADANIPERIASNIRIPVFLDRRQIAEAMGAHVADRQARR